MHRNRLAVDHWRRGLLVASYRRNRPGARARVPPRRADARASQACRSAQATLVPQQQHGSGTRPHLGLGLWKRRPTTVRSFPVRTAGPGGIGLRTTSRAFAATVASFMWRMGIVDVTHRDWEARRDLVRDALCAAWCRAEHEEAAGLDHTLQPLPSKLRTTSISGSLSIGFRLAGRITTGLVAAVVASRPDRPQSVGTSPAGRGGVPRDKIGCRLPMRLERRRVRKLACRQRIATEHARCRAAPRSARSHRGECSCASFGARSGPGHADAQLLAAETAALSDAAAAESQQALVERLRVRR